MRTDGSAYAIAPPVIDILSEFTVKCRMRMTNCMNDYNLFGADYWQTYTWSSSQSFATNFCFVNESTRFTLDKAFFSQMAEYKCVRRLDNGYLVNDVYVDGQLMQAGYKASEVTVSAIEH